LPVVVRYALKARLDGVECPAEGCQQFGSRKGQPDTLGHALKQPDAKLRFQLAHLTADGCLGHEKLLRRPREALVAAGGFETAKRGEGEPGTGHS